MKKEREGIVFGLMTDEEKHDLIDCSNVEIHDGYKWEKTNYKKYCNDDFCKSCAYRPAPVPEVKEPTFPEGFEFCKIDWDNASYSYYRTLYFVAMGELEPLFSGYG